MRWFNVTMAGQPCNVPKSRNLSAERQNLYMQLEHVRDHCLFKKMKSINVASLPRYYSIRNSYESYHISLHPHSFCSVTFQASFVAPTVVENSSSSSVKPSGAWE